MLGAATHGGERRKMLQPTDRPIMCYDDQESRGLRGVARWLVNTQAVRHQSYFIYSKLWHSSRSARAHRPASRRPLKLPPFLGRSNSGL
eukprot:scaffold63143_cov36-Tisochrysis_lutea.AAC.1